MYSPNHLTEYLIKSAQRFPDKTALIFKNEKITYSRCLQLARKFATLLKENGFKAGDRILVANENCSDIIIVFWGTLLADGVICIVDPNQTHEKLAYMFNDSASRVFVGSDLKQYTFLKNNPYQPLLLIDLHLLSLATQVNDCLEMHEKPSHLDIDLAAIIYTSGSTGEPKGVMLSHRNMLAASMSINLYLHNTEHDKVISVLPLSFDYGLYQMLLMFLVGGTFILEVNFLLPSQMLKKIVQHQATAVPVVPSMVPLLSQFLKLKRFDLSSVRYTTNTGASLHLNHIKALQTIFPQAEIYSMYGLTECKRCTYLPPKDIERKSDSIGIPIPNTQMWIVGEQGERLGANQIGEMVVRGNTLMIGYLNKPEATARKLKAGLLPGEKVLYTGDYGMVDEEGYFYFYGRGDDVIKSRGLKISSKEIEIIVNEHVYVKDSAAVAIPHDQYGQAIVLFIHSDSVDCQIIIERYCLQKLAKYQQPIAIISYGVLPKTTNGKIDKQLLKAHYLQVAA